jgi:hypothetical protein
MLERPVPIFLLVRLYRLHYAGVLRRAPWRRLRRRVGTLGHCWGIVGDGAGGGEASAGKTALLSEFRERRAPGDSMRRAPGSRCWRRGR